MDLRSQLPSSLSFQKLILVTMLSVSMTTVQVLSDVCDTLCDCKMESDGLLVDCTSRQLDTVPTDIPQETFHLKLSSNSISSLSASELEYLRSLRLLYLDGNALRSDSINSDAFQTLKNLENLDLSNNRIRLETNEISTALQPLTNLVWLDLSDNNMNTIEQGMITIFARLQTLSLSGNIFECDCDMVWFKNWLVNTRFEPPIVNGAECFQPAALRRDQIAYAEFCLGAGRCYQCGDAPSNEDCGTDMIQDCTPDQDSCMNEIRISNGVKHISKGCQQFQACLNNQQGNLESCNEELPDSACWYCCQGDLCNEPETAVVDNGCQTFVTPNQYRYQYPWPQVPRGITGVTFQLSATNDGHIALSNEAVNKEGVLEVVIGGWDNLKSVIRMCKQCSPLIEKSTPNILSTTEDNWFYITFEGLEINVGLRGGPPFMSYQLETEPTINYIGISTGWGAVGEWTFCGFATSKTAWSATFPTAQSAEDYHQDGAVWLAGNSTFGHGHVEIFHRGKWGRICDRKWSVESAMVTCRQLGLGKATAAFSSDNLKQKTKGQRLTYGVTSGTDFSWLNDVICMGHETALTFCQHRGWKYQRCPKSQLAYVVCNGDNDTFGEESQKRSRRQTKEATCPQGWFPFADNCYYVSVDEQLTFDDAQARCQEMGASLTSIHSLEEQQFISDLAGSTSDGRKWIGLTDRDVEGTFIWVDGTQLDYESWMRNQPDNDQNMEDCVQVLDSGTNAGLWNDRPCANSFDFICKKSSAVAEPTSDPSNPNQPQTSNPDPTSESPGNQFTCSNKANGLYPDPDDCNMFYACSNNGLSQFHVACNTGLVYNPYCSCCDWPRNYDCGGVSDFSCAGQSDGLYSDIYDCAAYFTCSAGQVTRRTVCVEDTVFNPETQSCAWSWDYECPLPPSTRTPSMLPSTQTPSMLPSTQTPSMLPSTQTPSMLPSTRTPSIAPTRASNTKNSNNIVDFVCERETFRIECTSGKTIAINSALYGRRDSSICASGGDTNCAAATSKDVVRTACEGFQSCEVRASNSVFGDPCVGTFKYLQISYKCQGPIQTPATTQAPTPASTVLVTGSVPVLPKECYAEESNEGDKGLIAWPKVKPGTTIEVDCPYQKSVGDTAYATRTCNEDASRGAYWLPAVVDDCPTDTEILEELAEEEITEDNADEVSEMLAVVTSNPDALNDNDVNNAVVTMEHLSDSIDTLTPSTSPDILTNVLTTVNHMVDVPTSELQESQRAENTSSRILKTVEEFALGVQFTDTSIIRNTQVVDMAVTTIDNNNLDTDILFRGVGSSNTNYQPELFLNYSVTITDDDGLLQASVLLPKSVLQTVADDIDRCQFTMFQDTTFFEVIDVGGPNTKSQDSSCQDPSASDDSLQPSNCDPSSEEEDDNQQDGDDDEEIITILNSVVISASIGDLEVNDLDEPVIITLRTINEDAFNPRCVFWDTSLKNGQGGWSDKGCAVNIDKSSDSLTVCECNHLTNFAMIMDVYKDGSRLSRGHTIALSVISYIGCAISFIALLLTIITYTMCGRKRQLKRGKTRKDRRTGRRDKRTKILLNLVVALLLVNLFFIVGALVADYSGEGAVCTTMAVILHYCLLSAMMWMALEAFDMYMALVKVFETYYTHYLLKMCLVGWGLPIIVMAITAGSNIDNYGYYSGLCWLSTIPFYAAFLAPVCVILLFNSIVFAMVTKQLCDMRKRKMTKSDSFDLSAQLRASFSITFLLGLTWILAIFAVGSADLAFSYLFAIVNSLQGFSLFFFQCVLNADIRKRWYRMCCPKCAPPEEDPFQSNDATSRRPAQHQKMSTSSMSPLTTSTTNTVSSRISQYESGHTYDNSSYNQPTNGTIHESEGDNNYDNIGTSDPDYEAIQPGPLPPRS